MNTHDRQEQTSSLEKYEKRQQFDRQSFLQFLGIVILILGIIILWTNKITALEINVVDLEKRSDKMELAIVKLVDNQAAVIEIIHKHELEQAKEEGKKK